MILIFVNILFLTAGTAGLYYGADLLVKGGAALARRLGVSSMVIGLTLVASATSAPELVVSLRAGLEGNSGIALGNVIGSNICNIALILGLCACVAPVYTERKWFRLDLPVMVLSAALLALFCFRGKPLDFRHGLLFLCGLAGYTFRNLRQSRKEEAARRENSPEPPPPCSVLRALLLIGIGLGLLLGGAEIFLRGTLFFARLLGIPDAVAGLTVVAVGTSLPELATSLVAAFKGERDIAIGNVVGSNIFNILGIVGAVTLLTPLRNYSMDLVDLGMLLLCSAGLPLLMRSGWRLARIEGALMLLLYCAYTVQLILCHGR